MNAEEFAQDHREQFLGTLREVCAIEREVMQDAIASDQWLADTDAEFFAVFGDAPQDMTPPIRRKHQVSFFFNSDGTVYVQPDSGAWRLYTPTPSSLARLNAGLEGFYSSIAWIGAGKNIER